MKVFALSLSALVFASAAQAQDEVQLTPTVAFLSPEVNFTPSGCDVNTKLVLDEGVISGKLAYFEQFVMGFCELYVPDTKQLMLIDSATDSCGSKVYTGSLSTAYERFEVEVVDHRARICRDIVPALVVVTKTSMMGEPKEILYSYSVQ